MSSLSKIPVIFLSEIDWDYLWQRHQIFARKYADQGHAVFYVNRPGMRLPSLKDIPYVLKRIWSAATEKERISTKGKKNDIQVINPIFYPGNSWVSMELNKRMLVPWFVKKTIPTTQKVILHAYQPTFLTMHIISKYPLAEVVYDCVQNFDEHPASTNLTKKIEKELILRSDMMITDSSFLYNKHKEYRANLLQVPPGVDFDRFNKTWRGDEMQKLQKFLYYGHVRDDLDLGLLNGIANHLNCNVTIVGKIADNLTQTIDSKIKIINQQPYCLLPNFIKSADVLLLPYKVNQFTSAIIPAKFFECLATGKPILSTRLPSLERYSKHITLVTNVKDDFQGKIKALENNHDRLANIELAKKSSWDSRFSSFYERLVSD